MFFGILTLLTSLLLALVSGWFSIAGLMAIFSGIKVAGLAAGVVCEIGKLAGVSWLYRTWSDKVWFRYPLLLVTIVAMFVTSFGVFGYLSKAHNDQGAPVANSYAMIKNIDEKINREKSKIIDYQRNLDILDQQLQVLIESKKVNDTGKKKGVLSVKQDQQNERDQLSASIKQSREITDSLENEKLKISQTIRDFEIDVGPVLYIAQLFYDNPKDNLEKAVKIVVLLIVITLDPMAILLLMGANHIFLRRNANLVQNTTEIVEENSKKTEEDLHSQISEEELNESAIASSLSIEEQFLADAELGNEVIADSFDYNIAVKPYTRDISDLEGLWAVDQKTDEKIIAENKEQEPIQINTHTSRYGSQRNHDEKIAEARQKISQSPKNWINSLTRPNNE